MSEQTYDLTHREGNLLLKYSMAARVPEKIGNVVVAADIRVLADDDIRSLRNTLRLVSEDASPGKPVRFGRMSTWVVNPDGESATLISPDEKIPVTFGEPARCGAYWVLLMMLHPVSPLVVDNQTADDFVWPLAFKLKLYKQLRKAIGFLPERRSVELEVAE